MSDVLIVIGAITLLILMAIGSAIVGNFIAKWLIWLWDRR